MRKITERIKKAFEQGQSLKVGNTETDGTSVWLFGNKIVRRDNTGTVWATLAGWNTPTTRERVNNITGLRIYQQNFDAKLDGELIDPDEWINATANLAPAPLVF
jgi:hypothetical protein